MLPAADSDALKRCCSGAYESEFARMLLGDSFHPGGLDLTRRLGELLELRPGMRVLDVASGRGESGVFLARTFGCEVVGIDFSRSNVEAARKSAAAAGIGQLATFFEGDAERMTFPDASFDYVICECAFCTFPDKAAAAQEFGRVLRHNGRIGISDLTRNGSLPPDLTGLIAWISCIADARPLTEYTSVFEAASFGLIGVEAHDNCLLQMVRDVQGRLLGIELLAGLKKLELPGVDITQAKQFARAAMRAIQDGVLGYSLIVAGRNTGSEAAA